MRRKIGLAVAIYIVLLIAVYAIYPERIRRMFSGNYDENPVRNCLESPE